MAAKHTKRFIVEIKAIDGSYFRSAAINGFFLTRELAQEAIVKHLQRGFGGMTPLTYRVRMK
jgi:tRNA threonylcarbamoyladenosine modification (KEOPS) complex  Pcc1 subunit